jgi:acetyl-CoA C-acetyltransferase
MTLNKVCGSGLKAVMTAAAMLRAGDAGVVVAGGMESMNGAPYLLPQARFGHRLGDSRLVDSLVHDGLWCSLEHEHMGLLAERTAEAYGVTREEMDAFSLRSQQRAVAAIDRGAFAAEIVPVNLSVHHHGTPIILSIDECPRRDTTLEKLGQLPPAFRPGGRVTAGNASPIADGAAALVVMRRERARELGCLPMARIVAYGQAAVPPGEIFAAPIDAVRKVLGGAAMSLAEIDLIELNEAFAAQALADGQALGLDWERVNVNGGAIALGHPIGASGARTLVTLLHALAERKLKKGLVVLCLGGGEAVAMIVEREG